MNYDDWKLDSPEFEDREEIESLELTVSGNKETVKEFEEYMIKLADKMGLELYY